MDNDEWFKACEGVWEFGIVGFDELMLQYR
jgi:hypothetical protein